MRINKKHVISLVLALAMVLSCIPAMTLAASAAEVKRPTGISVVRNYDEYMTNAGMDWKAQLGLSDKKVTIDGAEYAVTWEDPAKHIDFDTVGYYAVPGTIAETGASTYITVQVREGTNLVPNGYFSTTGGWSTPDSFTTKEIVDGEYHLVPSTDWGTLFNLSSNTTMTSNLNADLGESDSVTYYIALDGRASKSMTETFYPRLLVKYGDDPVNYYGEEKQFTTSQNTSCAVVEIPRTKEISGTAVALSYAMFYGLRGNASAANSGTDYYLDNAMLINVEVLSLTEEPAAITGIETAPVALGLVQNYDNYVDDWKAELNLPTEVKVATSDAETPTATVTVEWDYTPLKLETVGRYVLTGTLKGDYLNPNNLTVQQVIYVREKTNLIAGGDFENKDDSGDWSGWAKDFITEPDNANNSVYYAYKRDTSTKTNYVSTSGTQALYQISTAKKESLGAAVKKAGAGQYYIQLDVKSVSHDGTSDAREDMFVQLVLKGYDSNNASKALATVDYVSITTSWTTTKKVFDLTATNLNTYAATMRTDAYVKATEANKNGAVYFDNLELILIKQELPADIAPEDMTVKGATVDLGNSLDMNFYIDQTKLTAGESYTAKIVHTYADGRANDEKTVTVDTAKTDSTGYCYVTYQNIAAKEMGDQITVTFSDSKGNVVGIWMDSMKAYIERLMVNNADKNNLQTLCVDLLNYGAAAQQAFNYNVNDLVNADLGDKVGTTGVTATNNATGTWAGTTLTLESNIVMEVFFAKETLTGTETATVSYTTHYGEEVTKNVDLTLDAYYDMWSVKVDDLAIADTNTAVTVTIGDITVTDSMASYVARSQEDNTDAIYDAILAVGTSAKAYFESL